MQTTPPASNPPDFGPRPGTPPTESSPGGGSLATQTLRQGRRVVVAVIGSTLILFGIAMLVLPGPGLVTIAGGLAVLATEFVWARHWLKRIRERSVEVANSFLGGEKREKKP